MTFLLIIGEDVTEFSDGCILRSPDHAIFVNRIGDERVQKGIMTLMGKVAPPGAEYPLTEGVEKP
jgi:hypothetical protein